MSSCLWRMCEASSLGRQRRCCLRARRSGLQNPALEAKSKVKGSRASPGGQPGAAAPHWTLPCPLLWLRWREDIRNFLSTCNSNWVTTTAVFGREEWYVQSFCTDDGDDVDGAGGDAGLPRGKRSERGGAESSGG